ncbi:cytochrome c oxidase assembly protein COX14 homolog [Syngnathoides biaculeatus]|uniref:cytochrome c oxidase assembly protein COX14 homolog n=1 Tax=Syngnathoides biaculeatus TaxID=300417 RepID=UPI002ADE1B80|nr:cytochrome c oxidase assembly protein COX14 homolog [Syngnathoides biaculeatus]
MNRRRKRLPLRFPYLTKLCQYSSSRVDIECRKSTILLHLNKGQAIAMVTGKRLADMGYRAFSASMMLLTLYGGYLCTMRGYRYMQRQKELKVAAENQDPEMMKD